MKVQGNILRHNGEIHSALNIQMSHLSPLAKPLGLWQLSSHYIRPTDLLILPCGLFDKKRFGNTWGWQTIVTWITIISVQ